MNVFILTWWGNILSLACVFIKAEIGKQCSSAQLSCKQCITTNPRCTWCNDNRVPTAIRKNCKLDRENNQTCSVGVNSPQTLINKTINEEFTAENKTNVTHPIQLRPQEISLKLRIGQPTKVNITFHKLIDFPLDLYYVMDLSLSMRDDLAQLKILGSSLIDVLRNVTVNTRLGFGTFVDKVIAPFASDNKYIVKDACDSVSTTCVEPFGFHHQLKMSSDTTKFKQAVEETIISTNIDEPEGGFDALMQIAVCQDIIGWRKESLKVVLFTSDDSPHIALDGKLVQILKPNDMKCHMDLIKIWEYTESKTQDYPSLGQLKHVLEQNKVQTIFAVTQNMRSMYEDIHSLLPNAHIATLNTDSSNIQDIISSSYDKIRSRFAFNKPTAVKGLDIKHRVLCHGTDTWSTSLLCENTKQGQEVIIELEITANECPSSGSQTDVIKVTSDQISDVVTIKVDYHCKCSCEDEIASNNRSLCSFNGDFLCGMCNCDSGHTGSYCQCEATTTINMNVNCTDPKSPNGMCNNNGMCDCGECICSPSYNGTFCECSSTGCPSASGSMCGGSDKGRCENCYGNKQCVCNTNDGWYLDQSGECTCNNRSCMAAGSNVTCSGHGTCDCSTCTCSNTKYSFYLNTCPECYDCKEVCLDKDIRTRVLSSVAQCDKCKESYTDACKHCLNDDLPLNDRHDPVHCRVSDGQCSVTYNILWHPSLKTYYLLVKSNCEYLNPLIIALPTIGGVLLTSMIALLVAKILKTNYDKRKWEEFQAEVKKSKWTESNNPIHREAKQTFVNPRFIGNIDDLSPSSTNTYEELAKEMQI
uniref:Integrin beta n=1 Tax=Ciona intestinalis TaxID=7719 RepID=F6XBP2_CIOIN